MSPRWDLAVFAGPAVFSLLLLALGYVTGDLWADTPLWLWVGVVVLVDVAHVWATLYRVYLDPTERRRRPGIYCGVPLAAYVGGVVLYSLSPAWFWRGLAYFAVLHFVRQQWGWVKLYRRKLGIDSTIDRWLDDAAIYSATLYPLLYWHASMPRTFHWLIEGDFLPGVPRGSAAALLPLHLAITALWIGRQVVLGIQRRPLSPGKIVVVVTTWLCWHLGIIVFNSDFAFTVTNVLIHGIPYLALVWRWGIERHRAAATTVSSWFRRGRWPLYLLPLVALAGSEEWLWDRLVWHDHGTLFWGGAVTLSPTMLALLVPLVAVPQATHYALDAVLWRSSGENRPFLVALGLQREVERAVV